jgi:hypothetical protein
MPRVNTKILTTGILGVFRGLKFESDPREIGCAFHGAGADIGEKDSFRSGTDMNSNTVHIHEEI